METSIDLAFRPADGIRPLLLRRPWLGNHGDQKRAIGIHLGLLAIFGGLFGTWPQRRQLHFAPMGVENVRASGYFEAERDGLKIQAAQLALPMKRDKAGFGLFPESVRLPSDFIQDGAEARREEASSSLAFFTGCAATRTDGRPLMRVSGRSRRINSPPSTASLMFLPSKSAASVSTMTERERFLFGEGPPMRRKPIPVSARQV